MGVHEAGRQVADDMQWPSQRTCDPCVPFWLDDAHASPALLPQDQGLALHLMKAGLQWTSDAPSSTLWSSLLVHDLSLSPGEWPTHKRHLRSSSSSEMHHCASHCASHSGEPCSSGTCVPAPSVHAHLFLTQPQPRPCCAHAPVRAGATACAEGPDGPAGFNCPVAQVSAGVMTGRCVRLAPAH